MRSSSSHRRRPRRPANSSCNAIAMPAFRKARSACWSAGRTKDASSPRSPASTACSSRGPPAPVPHCTSSSRKRRARSSRSEEHTSELQSHSDLVCRLLLEKKKKKINRFFILKKKKKKKIKKKKKANK